MIDSMMNMMSPVSVTAMGAANGALNASLSCAARPSGATGASSQPLRNVTQQNYFIAPPAKKPISYSDEPVAFLAEKYVRGFLGSIGSPKESSNWMRINSFYWDNRGLCSELEKRCKDDKVAKSVSRVAISIDNGFNAGLCVGRLNANFAPEGGSFSYNKGLKLGQFYKQTRTPFLNAGLVTSAAVQLGSAFCFVQSASPVDREALARFEDVYSGPMRALALITFLSMGCGMITACSDLASGKLFEPESFNKSRIYNYQRHPIAASMMMYLGIFSLIGLYNSAVADDPSISKVAAMIGSSALFMLLGHKKIVKLEKGQEKFHGEKYVEYKNKTPMYVFDLWKFFKDMCR